MINWTLDIGLAVKMECFFGITLNDKHCTTGEFKLLKDYQTDEREIILWRAGIEVGDVNEEHTICMFHEQGYLTKYESRQMKCCDPLKRHKRPVKSNLRIVSCEQAKQIRYNVKPGQKICTSCRLLVLASAGSDAGIKPETPNLSTTDESETDVALTDALDASIQVAGCSPFKINRVSARDKVPYLRRKVKETSENLVQKAAKLAKVDADIITPERLQQPCDRCRDYDKLISELKQKFILANRMQKLQILTLVPDSWTIETTVEEFKTSKHMVKRARKLKCENGVLAEPTPKCGKPLSEVVKQQVVNFYCDDEFSRCCPGKKDCVSVKLEGKRTLMQKHLLLCNVKELYLEFLKRNPTLKIGFSTFCGLRPPWCITVASSGTHSVCVCESHQNVKLMLASIPSNEDYRHFLGKLVCDITSRFCMLHRCDSCPGTESLSQYITELFSSNGFEEDDIVVFKQWRHTDRTTLDTLQEPLPSFVSKLVFQLDALATHHYISQAQTSYVSQLKGNLESNQCIILGDFAENYSFIIQDAVQGQHWDNSQATLHPFVVYYCDNDNDLKSISVCVISDCMTHATSTVHAFQKAILDHLKKELPAVTKVVYFSDGCAGQYKNYKNFVNLTHHMADFGYDAEWHFFATSHGKSPCDGIGGTVKRLAARASLQATTDNQILTPHDLYQFGNDNIKGIQFFWVTKESVDQHINDFGLEDRYSSAKTVSGTRSHHAFVPLSKSIIVMRRISSDTFGTTAVVTDSYHSEPEEVGSDETHLDPAAYQPGQYIAAVYDQTWYIGVIVDRSDEAEDIQVKFMTSTQRSGSYRLTWPRHDDICWIPFQHVICIVPAPQTFGSGARQYQLDDSMLKIVKAKFSSYAEQNFKNI